jgi:virulence-associated protein VagC
LHITNLSDVTALIAILSFFGGIVIFLFKRIVIEPLQKSIDQLNRILEGFKETAEKRMEKIEGRLDKVEDCNIEQTQQIKTLFNNMKIGAETK